MPVGACLPACLLALPWIVVCCCCCCLCPIHNHTLYKVGYFVHGVETAPRLGMLAACLLSSCPQQAPLSTTPRRAA
ncbi:hypothetical protein IWZ01DRAFT_245727 [Phyllosticta capitalensis]